MPDLTTEIKTYIGQTGTVAFDGNAGLRIGKHYTGVPQDGGSPSIERGPASG